MADAAFQPSRRNFLKLAMMSLPALVLPVDLLATPVSYRLRRTSRDAIASQMVLIPRSAWNPARPVMERLRAASRFSRLTVHHSGSRVNRHTSRTLIAGDLTAIFRAHRSLDYGDIAYHLVVDYAGRVWEGRSLGYEGAHVMDANEGNIGVMLLGNFERQQPSMAQLTALDQLVDLLRVQYGIRRAEVFGHRDLGPTACPGRYLYPNVHALRQV